MAARLTGFVQRSADFVKKYATIAWRDHINKVAVCQANGQSMSRMQMLALYFKTELAPPNPIEAKESIAKFLDLPFKMSGQKIANMNVKEALCKSLLVADVAVFFVVGEVIGRRCWGGYKIPGAYGDTEMFTEEDIKKMDAERAKAN